MAIPPQLRYWQIRTQALLNKPVLWCSALAVVLLAVVLRQYQTHPEWLSQFEPDGTSSGQTLSDSTLSPEEQGGVADIDNLRALYSALNSEPSAPSAAASKPQGAAQPSADLLKILQSPAPATGQATNGETPNTPTSPFAAYLEQYRFLGQQNSAPALGAGLNTVQPTQPSLLNLTGSPVGSTQPGNPAQSLSSAPALSPLERALQQQLSRSRTGTPAAGQTASDTPDERPIESSALSPATLPGTNQTFLRTTPQMSPPPGTTGYVPPATLPNPATGTSAGAVYPVLPGAASVTPDLSPISPSQGALTVPQPGTTVLPPAVSGQYDAPDASLPQPAPFTVPRPPGSYTGGGYIYTFSDPNGPIQ